MRYAIFLASSSLAITFHLFSSGHSIQGCGEWKSISAVIKQKGMTFLLKKKKDCFMSVNCVIFAFFHLDSTKEITNYVFFSKCQSAKFTTGSSLELFMLERLTSQC